MIHDWELYSVQQDLDPELVRRSTELGQGMLAWMRKLDLSPREPVATDESAEAHDCEGHTSHNAHDYTHTSRDRKSGFMFGKHC